MPPVRLSRRSFLKGVAGASLMLPTLEAMLNSNGTAFAAGGAVPKRYAVFFGGHSLGFGYNDPSKPEYLRPNSPNDMFTPNAPGRYDPRQKLAISSLAGVEDLVSVVSGLKIPYPAPGSTSIPAAGTSRVFHPDSYKPLITGNRARTYINSPSSDQLVADQIAGGAPFRSLQYRIQALGYLGGGTAAADGESIARAHDGSAITPVSSPALGYQSVFNAIAPTDPTQSAERDRLRRQHKSILDLVANDTQRLKTRLGVADQRRLDQHLTMVRSLESRLDVQVQEASSCQRPSIPTDPPLGLEGSYADGVFNMPQGAGWSGETERGKLFCDLIALAFHCDLSRVATVMVTMPQSYMDASRFAGLDTNVHQLSHFGGAAGDPSGSVETMSASIKWHVGHFAYLVGQLRDMMDDCALVYCCEGGIGPTLEGDGTGQYNAHSVEGMGALIAGRAGGLQPGQHVLGQGRHPAQVIISAMKAVGAGETLGEVSGAIPELFVPA